MKKLAVLDVGGSAIKYCTMCGTDIEGKGQVPTPDGESHDPEAFLETIESILERMGDVEGLALSMPGEVDARQKYIRTGGALLYNYGVDVTEWERRFGVSIEVENDARCSAIAELSWQPSGRRLRRGARVRDGNRWRGYRRRQGPAGGAPLCR